MASQDFYEIYRNVNQITRAVATTESSQVMAVHRMYFQLDQLNVELLSNATIVQELVVFADVVEIEGNKLVLPGLSKVTIACRILSLKTNDVALDFNFLKPIRTHHVNDVAVLEPDDRPTVELSIYAQQIVGNAGSMLRIRHPVIVRSNSSPIRPSSFSPVTPPNRPGGGPGPVPHVPTPPDHPGGVHRRPPLEPFPPEPPIVGPGPPPAVPDVLYDVIMEWRIGLYSAGVSNAELSHNLWVTGLGRHLRITEAEWSGYIAIGPHLIPPERLANSNILLGMQATLLLAELILSYQTRAPPTVAAALQHAEWISKQLLQVVDNRTKTAANDELLTLLLRAQSLLKLPVDGSKVLIVPRLEFDQYRNLISSMTTVAEAYNREFMDMDRFIQQNKILGSYLLEQNKAFAAKEREMEAFRSLLVDRKLAELDRAILKMDTLNGQLEQQKAAMDQAQEDMEKGLLKFKNQQVARAFFDVIKACIAIGVAVATGGATAKWAISTATNAVNSLANLAKSLKMVMTIMESLEMVIEVLHALRDLGDAIADLNKMLEAPQMPIMPSIAEWDIFENEIEAVAADMPEEVSPVTWKTKCKNVAALCREITTTGAYIGQLQYDLLVEGKQEEIAMNQAKRLEAMQPVDLNNYLAMATELDMRTIRMLFRLLKTLVLQNGALQFHFLLSPSPVSGWVNVDTVRNALVQHDAEAVSALERLGPNVDLTREYVLRGIPVSLLLDGDDWNFTIPVDDSAFPAGWSRVRIKYLEMRFLATQHQPSTSTGKVYILLQASRIFQDRLRGSVLHYEAAVPLQYPYAYNLETGQTTLPNQPTDEDRGRFMRMTPFTQWKLRLSASAYENEGLAFPTAMEPDSTTQISITFFLTAIRAIDVRVSTTTTPGTGTSEA